MVMTPIANFTDHPHVSTVVYPVEAVEEGTVRERQRPMPTGVTGHRLAGGGFGVALGRTIAATGRQCRNGRSNR
jgi:hypothetical protein